MADKKDNNQVTEENKSVTPIDELLKRSGSQIVELPGFGDGKPFYAKLRRVTILEMAHKGEIPNELLTAVHKLYSDGLDGKADLAKQGETLRFFAEKSLVEPTLKELDENGIKLTDQQLNCIYIYSVRGEELLSRFR